MVTCLLCYRACTLREGQVGVCRVVQNLSGAIVPVSRQCFAAEHIDPIEKKPLYHFYPLHRTYSLGMYGCNLDCDFCQNHSLVSGDFHKRGLETSSEIIRNFIHSGTSIVSYTYSEPIVWQPHVLPVAQEVHRRGGLNVLVTNGTFSRESLTRLHPLIDALNIDLKGDEEFYRSVCHSPGAYEAVLEGIDFWVNQSSAVVEVTTLLIDGYHSKRWVESMGRLLHEIGVKVWHLSRFHPSHRMMHIPATSAELMQSAYESARNSGIGYVYLGNVDVQENYFITCGKCGYSMKRSEVNALADTEGILRCPQCQNVQYGRFGEL